MFTIRFISRIANPRLVSTPNRVVHAIPFRVTTMASDRAVHLNRLSTAKSPYLRQHATNPVDWYPFEKAALDKAKVENKVSPSSK